MDIDWDRFRVLIEELIRHRSRISKVPIIAENREELVWASLVFIYGEGRVKWTLGKHEPSIDIRVKVNDKEFNIALKSGEIKRGKLSL